MVVIEEQLEQERVKWKSVGDALIKTAMVLLNDSKNYCPSLLNQINLVDRYKWIPN